MARLTPDQLAFLLQHQIPADRVFDAGGKSNALYQAEMKRLEAWIAYGVTPCTRAGHTLRTRKGHCVQCTPANLSYLRRFDEAGEVYVAESVRGHLVKVGTSINAAERVQQLNVYQYGGRADWTLRFKSLARRAGRVESEAHRRLAAYPAAGTYFKNGDFIDSQEIFSCSVEQAIEAIRSVLTLSDGRM